MVRADQALVRSAQVGRRPKKIHIRRKHEGVGLEHDDGESGEVGDQSDQDGVRRNEAQVEPDDLGVESDVVVFRSAPSGSEPDEAEVGPNQARVRLADAEVARNVAVAQLKPCGGGPKQVAVGSDEVGIQSTDPRFPSRASR